MSVVTYSELTCKVHPEMTWTDGLVRDEGVGAQCPRCEDGEHLRYRATTYESWPLPFPVSVTWEGDE